MRSRSRPFFFFSPSRVSRATWSGRSRFPHEGRSQLERHRLVAVRPRSQPLFSSSPSSVSRASWSGRSRFPHEGRSQLERPRLVALIMSLPAGATARPRSIVVALTIAPLWLTPSRPKTCIELHFPFFFYAIS